MECSTPATYAGKPLTCPLWRIHVWNHESVWKRGYSFLFMRDVMLDRLGM